MIFANQQILCLIKSGCLQKQFHKSFSCEISFVFLHGKKGWKIKKSKKISAEEGLWLSFYSNTSLDFGELKIFIHNYTENPKNIYRKGSLISSGANNYFLVKRTLDQKLESPFNSCLKDINQFAFNKIVIAWGNLKAKK